MTWPSGPFTVAPWTWPGARDARPRLSSTSRPWDFAAASIASVAFARLPSGLDISATFRPLSQLLQVPLGILAGMKVITWAW